MSVQRIQLMRTKGWRKPLNTVVVARPSTWGNPYRVVRGDDLFALDDNGESIGGEWHVVCAGEWSHQDYIVEAWPTKAEALAAAVRIYHHRATEAPGHYNFVLYKINAIRGKNLACWCPLDQPCHADVLLDLANGVDPQPDTEVTP